jgi:hypothetical protein
VPLLILQVKEKMGQSRMGVRTGRDGICTPRGAGSLRLRGRVAQVSWGPIHFVGSAGSFLIRIRLPHSSRCYTQPNSVITPTGKSNVFLPRPKLERSLFLITMVFGAVNAWAGRFSMNPDGISYLDVGSSFARHDWAHAFNAWWSPLYPWSLGILLSLAKPSPRWEFPLVQAFNFVLFVTALFAFRYFLGSLLNFCHRRDATASTARSLPDWALILIGYATFWWASLELVTIYDVSPDLAVLAVVCLAGGLLLRLDERPDTTRFALFGIVLGIAYWIKAVLFPLGFVFLACAFLWKHSSRDWRRGILAASILFICVAAPLVLVLSKQKGRFTFGDTGKAAYAWGLSPSLPNRNWQGEVASSGTPLHATRQLFRDPPVFEFDGPVVGTYPPWTDPSYWNEGLRPNFTLRAQIQILASTVPSEVRVLLRAQPGLVIVVIVLVLMCPRQWVLGIRGLWPFLAMPLVGMAFYLPMLVNDRYLAAFALLLFVVLCASAQVRPEDQTPAAYVMVAVFIAMALGTLDGTVRNVTNHLAIPGVGPNSTLEDVVVAEQLPSFGAGAEDKVAVIGGGTGSYWARLAKVRIVAEIMGSRRGAQAFWKAPDASKQKVYAIFGATHSKLVVSSCPPVIPSEWTPIKGTNYCVLQLAQKAAPAIGIPSKGYALLNRAGGPVQK